MTTLTNTQLDTIIAKADATYDGIVAQSGDYDKYHAIAKDIIALDFGIEDYSYNVIDDRCMEIAQIELDRRM